jgi:hypothetical protein
MSWLAIFMLVAVAMYLLIELKDWIDGNNQ